MKNKEIFVPNSKQKELFESSYINLSLYGGGTISRQYRRSFAHLKVKIAPEVREKLLDGDWKTE